MLGSGPTGAAPRRKGTSHERAGPVQPDADRLPTAWFNINPALPGQPLPPLHPGTHEPIGPADLAPLFPEALIMQEVSTEPWIDIPARSWTSTDCGGRPSCSGPVAWSRPLQTRADLLQVRRDLAGGVAQAQHRGGAGLLQQGGRDSRLATETGAGQWGSALALAWAALRTGVLWSTW